MVAEEPDAAGDAQAHRQRAASDQAESLLRDRRARVRVCAWCGAVSFDGEWYPAERLMTYAWRLDPRASHTICPTCFAEAAPGVPYPTL